MARIQTQTLGQQQEPRVKVEGGRIIVERKVELETIWNVGRIALDPRVYILYAYAQKYLGYTGSLRGVRVRLHDTVLQGAWCRGYIEAT